MQSLLHTVSKFWTVHALWNRIDEFLATKLDHLLFLVSIWIHFFGIPQRSLRKDSIMDKFLFYLATITFMLTVFMSGSTRGRWRCNTSCLKLQAFKLFQYRQFLLYFAFLFFVLVYLNRWWIYEKKILGPICFLSYQCEQFWRAIHVLVYPLQVQNVTRISSLNYFRKRCVLLNLKVKCRWYSWKEHLLKRKR